MPAPVPVQVLQQQPGGVGRLQVDARHRRVGQRLASDRHDADAALAQPCDMRIAGNRLDHDGAVDIERIEQSAGAFQRRHQHHAKPAAHRRFRRDRRHFHHEPQPRGAARHRERHRRQQRDAVGAARLQPLRAHAGPVAQLRRDALDARARGRVQHAAVVQRMRDRGQRHAGGAGNVVDGEAAGAVWRGIGHAGFELGISRSIPQRRCAGQAGQRRAPCLAGADDNSFQCSRVKA
ncbi:hypothetical protein D3C72_1260950 [compost metagenome]